MSPDDLLIQQLVQRGVLGQDGLLHLHGQAQAAGKSLGALLIARGLLTPQQLNEITVTQGGLSPAQRTAPTARERPSSGNQPVLPPADDEVPARIGPFEIQGVLAEGGMGVVYRASQRSMQRTCALKVVSSMQIDEETVERFVAEARVAARLGAHPNLVRIYDAGRTGDGRAWLAMELVEGSTLAEWIGLEEGTPQQAAAMLAQVCDALAHVHQQGIVHRDIKPANILIDHRGVPKLSDFGIAKALTGGGSLTTTGSFLGTPGYMAPEQAEDPRAADARADVYGIGAVLYEILTKRPPYTGASAVTILSNMLTTSPPAPRDLVPEVDPRLEAVCMRALERDPSDRYSNAVELQTALEAALLPEEAPEAASEKTRKGSARHKKHGSARHRRGRSTSSRRAPQARGRKSLSRSSSAHRLRAPSSAKWPAVAGPGERKRRSKLVPIIAIVGLLVLVAVGLVAMPVEFMGGARDDPETASRGPAPRLKTLSPRDNARLKSPLTVEGTVSPANLDLRLVATPDDPKTKIPDPVLLRTPGEGFSTKLRLAHGGWTLTLVALPKGREPRELSQLTIHVDMRPPELHVEAVPERVTTEKLVIAGTCKDNNDVTLTLDGLPVALVDGGFRQEVTLDTPGPKTLRLRATDALDNTETRSLTFTFAPPTLKLELDEKLAHTRVTPYTVRGRVNPRTATVTVAGEAVPVAEDGSFAHELELVSGTQRVEIVAADDGKQVKDLLRVVLDRAAPTITYDGVRKLRTRTSKIRLVFGKPIVEVQVGDQPPRAFETAVSEAEFEQELSEGMQSLRISAVDRAGNRGTLEVPLEVDTLPPVIDYKIQFNKRNRPTGVRGTLTDAGSSVKLVWGAKTILRKPGPFHIRFPSKLPRGVQSLVATDGAGNETRKSVVLLNLLRNRDTWNSAKESDQDAEIAAVSELLGPGWRQGETRRYTCAGITHRLASFIHGATSIEMILVPGAKSKRGTPTKSSAAEAALYKGILAPDLAEHMVSLEGPVKSPRVAPFLIGRHEVTVGEWDALHLERPGPAADAQRDAPIHGVSWPLAQRWLTAAGDGLRLPSEAEWEYACRAGSTTRYFWGDAFDGGQAVAESPSSVPRRGSTARNAFGLSDMSGNAWEWCQDPFKGDYANKSPFRGGKAKPAFPWGPLVITDKDRVLRGGSCRTPAPFLRSAARFWGSPQLTEADVGFRVVCGLPEKR